MEVNTKLVDLELTTGISELKGIIYFEVASKLQYNRSSLSNIHLSLDIQSNSLMNQQRSYSLIMTCSEAVIKTDYIKQDDNLTLKDLIVELSKEMIDKLSIMNNKFPDHDDNLKQKFIDSFHINDSSILSIRSNREFDFDKFRSEPIDSEYQNDQETFKIERGVVYPRIRLSENSELIRRGNVIKFTLNNMELFSIKVNSNRDSHPYEVMGGIAEFKGWNEPHDDIESWRDIRNLIPEKYNDHVVILDSGMIIIKDSPADCMDGLNEIMDAISKYPWKPNNDYNMGDLTEECNSWMNEVGIMDYRSKKKYQQNESVDRPLRIERLSNYVMASIYDGTLEVMKMGNERDHEELLFESPKDANVFRVTEFVHHPTPDCLGTRLNGLEVRIKSNY